MSERTAVVCLHCFSENRVPSDRLSDGPKCGHCKLPLFKGEAVAISTEEQFDRLITRSDQPVVVDFWASWCGPCKMMAPVFSRVADQLNPQYRLVKVETETLRNLSARYAIRSIPTLILFHKGQEIKRQAGAMDQRALVQWITQ